MTQDALVTTDPTGPSPARPPDSGSEPAARYLRIEQRWPNPRLLVCTPIGELDLLTAPLLQQALDQAHKHGAAVVADLTQLRFMGVAGVEALLGAAEQAGIHQHAVAVIAGPRPVQRLLELTGADEVLTLQPTLAHAIHAATVGNPSQHIGAGS